MEGVLCFPLQLLPEIPRGKILMQVLLSSFRGAHVYGWACLSCLVAAGIPGMGVPCPLVAQEWGYPGHGAAPGRRSRLFLSLHGAVQCPLAAGTVSHLFSLRGAVIHFTESVNSPGGVTCFENTVL